MEEYDVFEKRRAFWFAEVWKVKKNGNGREHCNQDLNRGCVELVWL